MASLTIIIPTVDGRDEHLRRLIGAIYATLPHDGPGATVTLYSNLPTCGEAWNRGVAEAKTDLVCCLADDLEPLPGWYEAAIQTIERGAVPAPYLWTQPANTFESGGLWQQALAAGTDVAWSAVPFCRREWWTPIPPIHYFSDNAYTDAQRISGRPALVTPGFAFNHWWAQEGRQPMHGPQWYREEAAWSVFRQDLLRDAAGRVG